ncbi:putative I-connectin [Operophtera brumata]|uniref:Putative I-connectin n=1 Tax=Operophtera brumata TaxID=104452 RepID=A0A0L7LBU5_OPEBR|nr:putative I-connectin [Operophtera brumata]
MVDWNIETRCKVCHLVFCCGDCRWGHEKDTHGLTFDCPICRGFKFLCKPGTLNQDFIEHLAEEHLPLYCNKCEETFINMEDLINIDKCTSISELIINTSVPSKDYEEKFDSIYEKSKSINEENCEGIIVVNKRTKTAIITPIMRKKHLVDYECSDTDEDQEDVMKTPHPKLSDKSPKVKRQRSQTPHVKKFLLRQKVVEVYEEIIDEENNSPKTTPKNENGSKTQNEMTTPTSHISNLLKLTKTVTTSTPTHPASKSEVLPKLKSIIISNDRRLGSQDSSEKHVTFQESGVSDGSVKKKVTFADNTVFAPQDIAKRVFRKPKRMLTPGPQKPRFAHNPRFQALLNRFENQGIIMARTPINNREKPQESTPPVGELSTMPARAINFKDDSPMVEADNFSKESNDSFKSCSGSPDINNAITALTANIAGTLQTCLHSAFKTTEEETEIQFNEDPNKENMWSSVARAVRNVFWGEHGPHFASGTPHRSNDSTSSSASKRKIEEVSDTEHSPLNHKKHKYNGRIRGRPPLRRCGVSGLRQTKSAEQYGSMKDMGDDAMNLSF